MTLPHDYRIRLMAPTDYAAISEICRIVYPHDAPYTAEELTAHHALYPQGQFVAEHTPTGPPVAGALSNARVRSRSSATACWQPWP